MSVAAFGRALTRLAAEEPSVVLVTGRDAGPLKGTAETLPERHVVVPGRTARVATGEGLASAGRVVVTVADGLVDRSWCRWPQVLVTTQPPSRHVGGVLGLTGVAAGRCTVVRPGWPLDVGPLLRAVVASGHLTLLVLHDRDVGLPLEELPPVELGVPRTLRPGEAGVLVGSGWAAPLALQVARMAAGRGVDLACVEWHTIPAGIDAASLEGALLLGDAGAISAVAAGDVRGMVLRRLRVARGPGGDVRPRATMEAVLEAVAD